MHCMQRIGKPTVIQRSFGFHALFQNDNENQIVYRQTMTAFMRKSLFSEFYQLFIQAITVFNKLLFFKFLFFKKALQLVSFVE